MRSFLSVYAYIILGSLVPAGVKSPTIIGNPTIYSSAIPASTQDCLGKKIQIFCMAVCISRMRLNISGAKMSATGIISLLKSGILILGLVVEVLSVMVILVSVTCY